MDRFAGETRHVADFLSEGLLARQPARARHFEKILSMDTPRDRDACE